MASLSFVGYYLSLFIHLAAILFLVNIPNSSCQACHGHLTLQSENHPALFIFGGSSFDVGNNNYINTTTSFQANYLPYGETFFKYPTGRFSDGRLIPDFIAEYAKLPFLPPYKQPGIVHQLTNGVNFASAGAGVLAQTHQGRVIDLDTQLIYFKNVEKLLEKQLGDKEEAKKMLSRAVYLFSIGSNDYSNRTVSPAMVIHNLTAAIKVIYKTGGRKFGFVGLEPLGCLPRVKASAGIPEHTGLCVERLNTLAKRHNTAFSKALRELESNLQGFKYSYFDFYTTTSERMDNPSKYGFKEGECACCGIGRYRGINSCGGKRAVKKFKLCKNASEYVFFDAAHQSEMANQQNAELMWSGTTKVVWPYNLKALFEDV